MATNKPDKRYGHTRTRTEQGERTPRLPHEHDESSDSQATKHEHEEMRRAHDDVSRGLVDTDKGGPMDELYGRTLRGKKGRPEK